MFVICRNTPWRAPTQNIYTYFFTSLSSPKATRLKKNAAKTITNIEIT